MSAPYGTVTEMLALLPSITMLAPEDVVMKPLASIVMLMDGITGTGALMST